MNLSLGRIILGPAHAIALRSQARQLIDIALYNYLVSGRANKPSCLHKLRTIDRWRPNENGNIVKVLSNECCDLLARVNIVFYHRSIPHKLGPG